MRTAATGSITSDKFNYYIIASDYILLFIFFGNSVELNLSKKMTNPKSTESNISWIKLFTNILCL